MSNEPVAWLYTAAHEPWNRHLEWVENANGYRGDWIKTPLSDRDDTALLRKALEFCEFVWRDVSMNDYAFEKLDQTITALRERLGEQA